MSDNPQNRYKNTTCWGHSDEVERDVTWHLLMLWFRWCSEGNQGRMFGSSTLRIYNNQACLNCLYDYLCQVYHTDCQHMHIFPRYLGIYVYEMHPICLNDSNIVYVCVCLYVHPQIKIYIYIYMCLCVCYRSMNCQSSIINKNVLYLENIVYTDMHKFPSDVAITDVSLHGT